MTVGGCTLTCTGGGSAVVQGLVVLQGPGVVPVGRDHYDCCGVSRELPRCLKMDTPEEAYSFPIGNVTDTILPYKSVNITVIVLDTVIKTLQDDGLKQIPGVY
jgi:hypothetical protein